MSDTSDRYFKNPHDDFDEGAGGGGGEGSSAYLSDDLSDFSSGFKADVRSYRDILMEMLYENREKKYVHKRLMEKSGSTAGAENDQEGLDMTVYTGVSGVALVYLKVAVEQRLNTNRGFPTKDLESKAVTRLQHCKADQEFMERRKEKPSFLGGPPGSLAILVRASVPGSEASVPSIASVELATSATKELLDYLPIVVGSKEEEHGNLRISNELLFGRAGYLHSLLYVYGCRDGLPGELTARLADAARQVCQTILRLGAEYSKRTECPAPLWWEWHDKEYLGIAHGVGGILYVLLRASRLGFVTTKEMSSLVRPSLDHLVKFQFRSGNFPSSNSSNMNDKLVHWCHGAPGMIHLMLEAHDLFGDESFLKRAKDCGSVIWSRGLLRKGYGLCHGVSGNAYAFLHLWRTTRNPMHLHRAATFISWCFDYGERGIPIPDRPFSLFEGVAGVVYLFTDVLQGLEQARFPAFEF